MFVTFILLIIFIAIFNEKRKGIDNYIAAVISWTTILYLSIEILSIYSFASKRMLELIWWLINGILLLGIIFLVIKKKESIIGRSISIIDIIKKTRLNMDLFIEVCFILILVGETLYIALRVAPYNWDSLTYHLPRIMHWVQNQSVAHYATNITRQVASPVLAEFINFAVYLEQGYSDSLFNILQWASYITSAGLVIAIAHKLKCSKVLSLLAGILFLTMPIAFAEAFTTQNDLLCTMWLLIFVYTILDLYHYPNLQMNRFYIQKVIILSLAIGFGYLTKPSIMFAVVVFAFGLLIIVLKERTRIIICTKLLLLSIAMLCVIVLPETARNINTFHAFSDPIVGERQLVGTWKPNYLGINFLKNFIYNSPNNYVDSNELSSSGIYFMANKLHVNVNDPSISEDGEEFRMAKAGTYNHNGAVNPVIWWMMLILSAFTIIYKIKFTKEQLRYMVASIIGFLLLCLCLRWEPYVARYMISYLALFCPGIVVSLNQIGQFEQYQKYKYIFIGVLLITSLSETYKMSEFHLQAVEYNKQNVREKSYFYICGDGNYGDYMDIVNYITEHGYTNIGLYTGYNSFEYPLWMMLKDNKCKIEHVEVSNMTSKYDDASFVPDCIFVRDHDEINGLEYHGVSYVKENPETQCGTFLLIPEK